MFVLWTGWMCWCCLLVTAEHFNALLVLCAPRTNEYIAATNKIKSSRSEIWYQELCLAVFAVQNRPGTRREEDWEIPQSAHATHGGQGVPQCCHGNRLKGCQENHCSAHISLETNLWDCNKKKKKKLGQEMLLCTEVDWWQVWSIFTPQTPLWKSSKISAFNWKLIFIFGY